jgi:hypothetical protein
METPNVQSIEELSCMHDNGFSRLQAQLATSGIELHRVTTDRGSEGFSVSVKGQLRTLDTLPQVAAYAKCLGVVLVAAA